MPEIERPTTDRLIEILREYGAAGDILSGHAADEIERLRQLGKRNAQDLREFAAALGGEMADMVADECKITVKRMF